MDVWITLENHITMDGQRDEVGVEAQGTLTTVANTTALRYDEVDADGGITHAEILLFPDHVHIRRIGEVSSRMQLIPDGRGNCQILLAGGMLNMDTELHRYTAEQKDGGFRWELHYALFAGPGLPAEHRMTITARPI